MKKITKLLAIVCMSTTLSACGLSEEIKITENSKEYTEGEWKKEELAEHLKDMGFIFVSIEEQESTEFEDDEIAYVKIGDKTEFDKDDKFKTTDKVEIGYYVLDYNLTVENNKELKSLLSAKKNAVTPIEFCKKYKGRRIEFDGVVSDAYLDLTKTNIFIDIMAGEFVDKNNPIFTAYGEPILDITGMDAEYFEQNIKEGTKIHVIAEVLENDSTERVKIHPIYITID